MRPLKFTAPNAEPDLGWPIAGMAYVIAFMGPLAAGPIIGLLVRDWRLIGVGFLGGFGITLLNAWFSDRFVDSWIAKHQKRLGGRVPRVLANIVAFAWAMGLCLISMFAPLVATG